MNNLDLQDDPSIESLLATVADEFMERLRQGEQPQAEDYARRHPEIAAVIRRVLPALQVMRLSTAAAEPPVAPPRSVELLGTLGDFRLIREVGRGGMGVVYEALQISLGRRVALKVLPFAAALDPRQLQRFKNEAQAAAHLQHPSIVPVYGIGVERGVHYYAMQFIEGQSLDTLIDQLTKSHAGASPSAASEIVGGFVLVDGSSAQTDSSSKPAAPTVRGLDATKLSTTSPSYFKLVAAWGVQAAEALEHAHQCGVVHRDVKPGNLIVDVQGHLWIADFGLARCQSEANLTVTGDLVGTFRYMSPEQALGRRAEVDQRTDIYSLGATLYELLTLAPVFPGNDRAELLRRIADEEPTAPCNLQRAVPRELETIVLKALEKAREARYASAAELAEDLRRFLDNRPILARKPTLLEKVARWYRRNLRLVVTALLLLTLAVLGLTVGTVLISREQSRTQRAYELLRQEENRTRLAYQAEARQRTQAEGNFRQARQAVDAFVALSDTELAETPEARRKFLAAALEYYQNFIEQQRNDASVKAELESSYTRVANILKEIGSPLDALAATKFLQGGGQLQLLSNDSVRRELRLSEEQGQHLKELQERRAELFRDPRGWTPDDWYARAQKLAAWDRTALTLLDADQGKRLRQIALQQQGVQAFLDPEVAEALRLTADQREKMRSLNGELRRLAQEDLRRAFSPGKGGGRGGPPFGSGWRHGDGERRGPSPTEEETAKNLRAQVLKVLGPEQKEVWQEMTGEPFRGEVKSPGGFVFPPGPGGFRPPPWP
ncbi:MAG: serine/threonine protein kinase [Planctomycetia bacterium]|nr:serine/threonine protein kinase [Planctomycetia bacterium]